MTVSEVPNETQGLAVCKFDSDGNLQWRYMVGAYSCMQCFGAALCGSHANVFIPNPFAIGVGDSICWPDR